MPSHDTEELNAKPTVAVTIGEPGIVVQGPPELDRAAADWGRWQFPLLNRQPDGQLHVCFSIEPDSYASQGRPKGHAYSSDNGITWQSGRAQVGHKADEGILLPNGDRLKPVKLQARNAEEFDLPESVSNFICSYGYPRSLYCAQGLPEELTEWRFSRLPSGENDWIEEVAEMHIPNEVRCVIQENRRHSEEIADNIGGVKQGVFPLPSLRGKISLAPDGSLWASHYDWRLFDSRPCYVPMFFRSLDNGHTWELHSQIRYQPDESTDPFALKRDGYTEPGYSFMPDGSVICLMRTMDGNGHGPLYLSRSNDLGRSWSRPELFDTFGKKPQLLRLRNGVTLSAHGASGGPGYFVLRATSDPSGRNWQKPVTFPISPPEPDVWDTCGHAAMVALNDNAALIVYSDFNYPDTDGVKRKTILVRSIKTQLVAH